METDVFGQVMIGPSDFEMVCERNKVTLARPGGQVVGDAVKIDAFRWRVSVGQTVKFTYRTRSAVRMLLRLGKEAAK